MEKEKSNVWDIEPSARKFHYWRGFAVGAVVGGAVVFVILANIIISVWG
jgi:hypothetical protein